MFASQAAIALSLLGTARSARDALNGDGRAAVVAELAEKLDRLDGKKRDTADALLANLVRLLS